jgi:16S rRNA (uracil1498-N3)-methyltransferase
MSHNHRFYLPSALQDESVRLSGEEARHAVKALRIKTGEDVTLMDGRGRERVYRVTAIIKDELVIETIAEIITFPSPKVRPVLILGAPDVKALDDCLLHATELGLFHIAVTKASHSPLSIDYYLKREERLGKIAVSAIKQSGNPHLPIITFHNSIDDALKTAPKEGLLFDKEGPDFRIDSRFEGEVALCVGPEGDFSNEEKELMQALGYKMASLGPYTLRVETAAQAAISRLLSPAAF